MLQTRIIVGLLAKKGINDILHCGIPLVLEDFRMIHMRENLHLADSTERSEIEASDVDMPKEKLTIRQMNHRVDLETTDILLGGSGPLHLRLPRMARDIMIVTAIHSVTKNLLVGPDERAEIVTERDGNAIRTNEFGPKGIDMKAEGEENLTKGERGPDSLSPDRAGGTQRNSFGHSQEVKLRRYQFDEELPSTIPLKRRRSDRGATSPTAHSSRQPSPGVSVDEMGFHGSRGKERKEYEVSGQRALERMTADAWAGQNNSDQGTVRDIVRDAKHVVEKGSQELEGGIPPGKDLLREDAPKVEEAAGGNHVFQETPGRSSDKEEDVIKRIDTIDAKIAECETMLQMIRSRDNSGGVHTGMGESDVPMDGPDRTKEQPTEDAMTDRCVGTDSTYDPTKEGECPAAAQAPLDSALSTEVSASASACNSKERDDAPEFPFFSVTDVADQCNSILEENRASARNNAKAFGVAALAFYGSQPKKIYNGPDDYPFFPINIASHKRLRPMLVNHMRERVLANAQKQVALQYQFREYNDEWKRRIDRLEQQKAKKGRRAKVAAAASGGASVGAPSSTGAGGTSVYSRSSRRGTFASDTVKSELEWHNALKSLGILSEEPAEEEEDRCATIPAMVIDPLERKILQYRSRNGLVENPTEQLRVYNEKVDLSWSESEKEIFKNKIIQYGKNFPKISSFLPLKNCQDCVQYYYREKMNLNFKQLIKNAIIRKRRAGAKRTGKSAEQTKGRFYILGSASSPTPRRPTTRNDEDADEAGETDGRRKRLRVDEGGDSGSGSRRSRRNGDRRERGQEKLSQKERAQSSPGNNGEEELRISVEWLESEKSAAMEAFAKFGRDFSLVSEAIGKSKEHCREFYALHRRQIQLNGRRLAEDGGTGGDEEEEQEKTRRRRSGRKHVSSDAAQTQVEGGEDLGDELLQTADVTEEEVGSDIAERLDSTRHGDKEGDEEESGDEGLVRTSMGRNSGQKNKNPARDEMDSPGTMGEDLEENGDNVASLENDALNRRRRRLLDDPPKVHPPQRRTVSYWSVAERSQFSESFVAHGVDWDSIAKDIGSKSAVQARNYYHTNQHKFDAMLQQGQQSNAQSPHRDQGAAGEGSMTLHLDEDHAQQSTGGPAFASHLHHLASRLLQQQPSDSGGNNDRPTSHSGFHLKAPPTAGYNYYLGLQSSQAISQHSNGHVRDLSVAVQTVQQQQYTINPFVKKVLEIQQGLHANGFSHPPHNGYVNGWTGAPDPDRLASSWYGYLAAGAPNVNGGGLPAFAYAFALPQQAPSFSTARWSPLNEQEEDKGATGRFLVQQSNGLVGGSPASGSHVPVSEGYPLTLSHGEARLSRGIAHLPSALTAAANGERQQGHYRQNLRSAEDPPSPSNQVQLHLDYQQQHLLHSGGHSYFNSAPSSPGLTDSLRTHPATSDRPRNSVVLPSVQNLISFADNGGHRLPPPSPSPLGIARQMLHHSAGFPPPPPPPPPPPSHYPQTQPQRQHRHEQEER
ncbi:nuclear receptor co-repressor 1 [Borealophlyctis nickersoniae]|nr:nuclear receptor co-repressor 1 [Borealophlyctis nickersoniae]